MVEISHITLIFYGIGCAFIGAGIALILDSFLTGRA